MEVIKRKISFEPATYRGEGTVPYGTMTANTFYIKIMLTQNIDDMGMFTDMPFIPESNISADQPDYTILQNKLVASGFTFPFMSGQQPPSPTTPIYEGNVRLTGKELSDYWKYADKITGATDSKKTDVKGYKKITPFITNFDINKTIYTNYLGNTIDGRSRITQQGVIYSGGNELPTIYVFDANNDSDIGTDNQSTGLLYKDYTGKTRTVPDGLGSITALPLTELEFTGEGWNETNTSLSAQTKEEYLFGITQPPEVFSDVFIDRGATTVLESHLRLSEVESLEHMERYNNGFYKLVKQ